MNNKYASHAFIKIKKQLINIEQHEIILSTFAGEDFLNLLRPVAKFLSENTTRTYISYLIEAKEMILQGEKEMNVYEYFLTKMQHLKEGE